MINDKASSPKEYMDFLSMHGIITENKYNIIEQGKVNEITGLNEYELFELLYEVLGMKSFIAKKNECTAKLHKADK